MNKFQLTVAGILLALSTSYMQAQVYLYNKGDMYVGGTGTPTDPATLYIKGNFIAAGNCAINHVGKTILTGDFENKVTSLNNHVFSNRDGVFEFGGSAPQKITGTVAKAEHYIEFPELVRINMGTTNADNSTVTIDTIVGVTIKDLTFINGRIVIDSEPASAAAGGKTGIAHVLLENGGIINYKHAGNGAAYGLFQVKLDLGLNYTDGRLVGFASPFKKMYADYFLFNFLSEPKTNKLFAGSSLSPGDALWITNPRDTLKPGQGYVLGMGLRRHDDPTWYNNALDPKWLGALYSDVVKEEFSFARKLGKASFRRHISRNDITPALTDSLSGEMLNNTDVIVPIGVDFNYLGNPFMVPLDLSGFILDPENCDFGSFGPSEMAPQIYVLTEGSGTITSSVNLTATFETIAEVGSTSTFTGSPLISPMQMFAVKKKTATPNTFKLPLKERTHGNVPFLRSSKERVIQDELLIQTQDMITGGYDRLCVVFRNDGTLKSTHKYDAEKLFNHTGGVNQIYTRSSDNKLLTTNIIPTSTKELTMYMEPSKERQEVKLTASRLNSISAVSSIILYDKQTGKTTDLKKTPTYTFLSSPSDKTDRFVLRFSGNTTGMEDLNIKELSAYYTSGFITVQGLQESDVSNDIMVYNIQGQLLHRQVITDADVCRINKVLDKGIYLIKISGNPNVIKLPVK